MEQSDEGFQIKKLEQQNVAIFQKLIGVFQDVFEMEKYKEVGKPYLERILNDPAFIVFAVMYKNEAAGGLTAYELINYYSEGSEVFIYDIAIKSEFQRQGVGRKLLLALKKYCSKKGIKEFFVDAHEEDIHAVDFYNATGGNAEKVIQFSYAIHK